MLRRYYGLIMALCCLGLIVLSAVLAVRGNGASWLAFLLCPLMHLFMMRGHSHGGNHQHKGHSAGSEHGKKVSDNLAASAAEGE